MPKKEAKPPSRALHVRYQQTAMWLLKQYGSHEKLSQELYKEAGIAVAANSIGRWFRERTVPIHIAIAFARMTDEPSVVGDFFPALHPYLIPEAKRR